jgi:multidrug resistance efflux pump
MCFTNHQRSDAAAIVVVVGWLACAALGQELPQKSAGERMEFEPDLILPDLPTAPKPVDELDVERARSALEKARQKARRWQRLSKDGVLAKVDAEKAALNVVRWESRLAAARAAAAQHDLEMLREDSSASPEQLAAATRGAEDAAAAAAQAQKALLQAEADAAALNAERHRKLYASRVVSRAQLNRAEAAAREAQAKLK